MNFLQNYGTGRLREKVTTTATLFGDHYNYHTIFNPRAVGKPEKHVVFVVDSLENLWAAEHLTFPINGLFELTEILKANVQYHVYELGTSICVGHDIVLEAARHNHPHVEVMIPIGGRATHIVGDVRFQHGHDIPLIFASVIDPVTLRLVSIDFEPQNNATGTMLVPADVSQSIEFVQAARSEFKHVMLPLNFYARPLGNYAGRDDLSLALQKNGCALDECHMPQERGEWLPIIERIREYDAVAIDYFSTDARQCLRPFVEECSEHGVTLLTSNITSVKEGAAVGFGYSGVEHSKILFPMMVMQLSGEYNISQIKPQRVEEESSIIINTQTTPSQGLVIGDELRNSFTLTDVEKRYGSLIV